MKSTRIARSVALLAAAALIAVGCSSSEETSALDGRGGDDSDQVRDNGKERDEGDKPANDAEAFCERVEEFDQSGVLSAEDPDTLDAGLAAMQDLAESAPPAIKEDVEVFVDVYEELASMSANLYGSGDDTMEDAARAQEEAAAMLNLMSREDVTEANANVEKFLVDNCDREPVSDEMKAEIDAELEASRKAIEQMEGEGG